MSAENPFILLVDDDPDKRLLMEHFLRKNFRGLRVQSVSDCASAFPLVNAPEPKVVITNGRISQKDGVAFAEYVIRESHAPVVMVSLRGEMKQKALDAGVTAFVETGEQGELRAAIKKAIEQVSGRKEQ